MSAHPAIAGHRARILVVDDEPDNRDILNGILGWEGFSVQTAACGDEALATVAAEPPDLILLDVMMPGMNGYEVATKIKRDDATSGIPIIIVTGQGVSAQTLGKRAGAEGYLPKPVNRSELVLRVKDLLRQTYADYEDN